MGAEANAANRAAGPGSAGGSVLTAGSRLAIELSALTLVLVGILVYSKNLKDIVPLGLPVTLVFSVGFYFVMRYLWENAAAVDRAKKAAQGAATK